jgi:Xaa-Pro aminopeptidase
MQRHFFTGILLLIAQQSFSQLYDTDLLTKEFHANRREALRSLMTPNSCAVFFANPGQKRANDTEFQYHQDPSLYYLTGLTEPDAMLIIFKEPQTLYDTMHTNELIFVKDRNPAREAWTGRLLGKEGAKKILGFKYPFINKELSGFPYNFSQLDKIYLLEPIANSQNENVEDKGNAENVKKNFYLKTISHSNSNTKLNTTSLWDWMASLREIKQPEEMVLMRKAIDMSCAGHLEVMKALVPGMNEYHAQAIAEYMFKKEGSEYVGYGSIVGGGENSCILHYITNRKKLEGKNLMVIDAGAEYHGYTADITRTLPVDGTFSKEETAIYNAVFEAQENGIKACRAGNDFRAPHAAAVAVVQKRLLELGIIKKAEEYSRYFFHGTSHYLGLDVHDAGDHGKLKVGNIITVEPGIYIPAGSPCDSKWWNVGVRIEDDIWITAGEPENLSGKLPRKIEEIEAIMTQESLFNKVE